MGLQATYPERGQLRLTWDAALGSGIRALVQGATVGPSGVNVSLEFMCLLSGSLLLQTLWNT